MDINKKLELIKRNMQEIVTEEELIKLLKTKKSPAVYLGTAVTGRPHVGYFDDIKNTCHIELSFVSLVP